MKILWQNNSSEMITGEDRMETIWSSLKRFYAKIASPGTEIKLGHLDVSTNYVRSFYAEFYNNIGIIEKVISGGQLLDDGTTDEAEEVRDLYLEENKLFGRSCMSAVRILETASVF